MTEEQTITLLPKKWKWVTFDDVCNKIGDIDHKMPKQIESGYPYVSTKDFTDDLKISFDRAKYISKEDFLLLSKKIKPEKGDIIFPRYGTIGKNILIDFDKEFLVSYSCAIVKPNTGLVIPKYIYLYSLSPRVGKEIEKYVVETTQANIGIASIKRFVFPLPPMDEQQQVISKIEELFSEIDKGIEEIKTAQQQLKVYRQAVLKSAFEGKLTNQDVKDDVLPKGWKLVNIQELAENNKHALKAGPFGSSLKKEFYVQAGYKIYGQEQVINDDPFYGDYYVSEEKYQELSSCRVKPFDILISLVGTVGKVLMLPENCQAGIINPRLIKISLNTKVYLPKFFKYYFESSAVKSFYGSETRGTTMDVLNLGIIKTIPFPLCSIEEQQQIVQEIESRLSVCDKIEETITNSLKQAEALRQSILKKAFEGRLVDFETQINK